MSVGVTWPLIGWGSMKFRLVLFEVDYCEEFIVVTKLWVGLLGPYSLIFEPIFLKLFHELGIGLGLCTCDSILIENVKILFRESHERFWTLKPSFFLLTVISGIVLVIYRCSECIIFWWVSNQVKLNFFEELFTVSRSESIWRVGLRRTDKFAEEFSLVDPGTLQLRQQHKQTEGK